MFTYRSETQNVNKKPKLKNINSRKNITNPSVKAWKFPSGICLKHFPWNLFNSQEQWKERKSTQWQSTSTKLIICILQSGVDFTNIFNLKNIQLVEEDYTAINRQQFHRKTFLSLPRLVFSRLPPLLLEDTINHEITIQNQRLASAKCDLPFASVSRHGIGWRTVRPFPANNKEALVIG